MNGYQTEELLNTAGDRMMALGQEHGGRIWDAFGLDLLTMQVFVESCSQAPPTKARCRPAYEDGCRLGIIMGLCLARVLEDAKT